MAATTMFPQPPIADALASFCMMPSTGDLPSFDPQHSSQLLPTCRSPYASSAQLETQQTAPGSSEMTAEDFTLPEPVPLEFVGSCEPLSAGDAEQLVQPDMFPWAPSELDTMLASSLPMPVLKQENQTEAVCSSSRARAAEARSPQTEDSSPSEKPEDRLENIRRTNREVWQLCMARWNTS